MKSLFFILLNFGWFVSFYHNLFNHTRLHVMISNQRSNQREAIRGTEVNLSVVSNFLGSLQFLIEFR